MAGEYKNNQQNNTSFIRQWVERCGNTSQDFHDDYHIDEIVDSLPKDKDLWWDASVHIYNDFTRYTKELNLEIGVMLCVSISDSYTKTRLPFKWDHAILKGVDTPPSLYIYNKDNADVILWLRKCSLSECKYIKGTKVYITMKSKKQMIAIRQYS